MVRKDKDGEKIERWREKREMVRKERDGEKIERW